MEKAA